MEQPKGFEKRDNEYVWKLKKTLYSIIQEVHNWAINLNKIFKDLGYYKSRADLQIQSQVINDEFMLTFTWTDDVLGVLSILSGEISTKDQFTASYNIKDIDNAKLILGIYIE